VEAVVAAHVHTPLTPPNDVVPEISQATSDALLKVLAKKPQDRFLSYDEFSNALYISRSQLLLHMSQSEPPRPSSKKTSWWRR
jgi:serine/threonine protein kinase